MSFCPLSFCPMSYVLLSFVFLSYVLLSFVLRSLSFHQPSTKKHPLSSSIKIEFWLRYSGTNCFNLFIICFFLPTLFTIHSSSSRALHTTKYSYSITPLIIIFGWKVG